MLFKKLANKKRLLKALISMLSIHEFSKMEQEEIKLLIYHLIDEMD